MTRNEILQATHANFSEFMLIWREYKRDRGLGALVFTSDEISCDQDEVQCEFWTLSELREYLRRMQQCDEVFYKWLKSAEQEGGYPVVIFSPINQPDFEQLHFSCVSKARVS
jgi:hypothetical protein